MATTKPTRKPAATPIKTTEVQSNGNGSVKSDRIGVLKTYKIFINGQFPRTESGRYYSLKLKDGSAVNMCLSSRKDIRNSVVAARNAQEKWAEKTAYNRSQILYRIGEMLETRSAQFIAELVSLGSSAAAAKTEVETAVDRLIYYAGWCDKYNQIFSSVNPVSSSHFNFSSTEPVGVVGMIAPESSALLGLISIIAPAIASGNTVIVLASESKALAAVTLSEVIHSSDVPAGVVNILTGKRSELAAQFSTHMDINAVYVNTNDAALKKQTETDAALNVKRARVEGEQNWLDESTQSPYRIMDYLEVKTTWHPIGI
ncbi:MAG: aldehyde dehydrogenase family protein [Bacteroidia bacterium]